MAKIFGLNGLISGRQGNNVFSIQNGTQVLKVYNPKVSNPRTLPQREQRAKFALAGKLSAATPAVALAGLNGGNLRAKRARFVSLVTNLSSVTGSADNLVASVPINQLVFSEGSLSRWSASFVATAVYNLNNVNVSIPAMATLAGTPSGYGEMVVVGLFDPEGRALDEVQAVIRSRTTASTLVFREFPTRLTVTVGVFACPFVANSSLNRGRSSFLYNSDENVALRVVSNEVFSGYSWGASQNVGVLQVSPATTMVSPSVDEEDMRKKK